MSTAKRVSSFLSTASVKHDLRQVVQTVVDRVFADTRFNLESYNRELGTTLVGYLPGESLGKELLCG